MEISKQTCAWGTLWTMLPLLDGAMELSFDKYRIKIEELEEAAAEKDKKLEEEKGMRL